MREPSGATWERLAILAGLAAIIAPYAWASSRYVLVLLLGWGDGWAHLGAIRRTIELGPFPGDVFYAGEPTPPYYSLAHLALALASQASGSAPHVLFTTLPPLFAALVILAVFGWIRALTGDVRAALGGAAIELLLAMPGPPWQSLTFPRNLALLPLYLAWLAYVRGRSGRELKWLLAAGVAFGLCLATHLFTGGLCLIGLALQELALSRGRPRTAAPLFLVVVCGIAMAAPWLGSFVEALRQRSEVSHFVFRISRKSLSLFAAWPWLRVMDPRALVELLPAPLWIVVGAGFGACAARARRRAATAADLYALAALGLALLLTLTPLFSLGLAAFGVWAPRLVLIAPFSLLCGLGVAALADGLREAWPARLASAALLSWAAFAIGSTLWTESRQQPELNQALRRAGPLGAWDLGTALARSGPPPAVVLTDPETANLLPYLLGSYVVAGPAAHGSPYIDHDAREKDARRFFSPASREADRREVLERYRVDAIAVAAASPWHLEGEVPMLLERLGRSPEWVDTGCCGDVVSLWRREE